MGHGRSLKRAMSIVDVLPFGPASTRETRAFQTSSASSSPEGIRLPDEVVDGTDMPAPDRTVSKDRVSDILTSALDGLVSV